MIKLKINGRDIEVEQGTSVLKAAKEVGVDIPHFCYHPTMSTVGSCRLCQVEIKAPGRPRLDVSCRTPVAEGMEVETHSEAAVEARAGVLEFLLANHPLDCPICDKAGECPLQNYTYECGFAESRFAEEKRQDRKRKRLGGHIVFDAERCILCTRCVRFFEEITGDPQLAVTGRGDTSRIDIFPGRELDSDYTGNLADICPVGALTLEEFRFKVRTWYLTPIPSVCPYCSRGCSINLDVRTNQNRLFRVRPRVNPAVNGYYICNEGRFRPLEAVAVENRLDRCLQAGQPCDKETALERAARALKEHEGHLLVVASPRRTLEELYLAREVFGGLDPVRFVAAEPEREEPDRILRTGEKAPNMKALELLDFEILTLETLGDLMVDEETDALVLLDAAIDLNPRMQETFKFILFMDYVATGPTAYADVSLPGLAWFEKEGTFINFEGRVQRIRPGLKPPGTGAPGDLALLAELGRLMRGEKPPAEPAEVFKALAEKYPPLHGMDYAGLGELGAPLAEEGGEPHE